MPQYAPARSAPTQAAPAPKAKVPATEEERLVAELEGMGFGHNRATRAMHACKGRVNLQFAANWLFDRIDDASLDAPLPAANGGNAATAPAASHAPADDDSKMSKSQKKRMRKAKRDGK